MKAHDVMVSPVITVRSSATLREVARLLLEKRISAVPVVDDHGKLVGMVSEGDLLHRAEIGAERRRSHWLAMFDAQHLLATDFIKSHARKVADVMARPVIVAKPDTPLHELATMMERHGVKRIPIVRDGALVGIVSRANLVQAVATAGVELDIPVSDNAIREDLMKRLRHESWTNAARLNATVKNGVVSLWGEAESETERKAIRVAAESAPGVAAVVDHITVGRLGAP